MGAEVRRKKRNLSEDSASRSRHREMRRRKQQQIFVSKNRPPVGMDKKEKETEQNIAESVKGGTVLVDPGVGPPPGHRMVWDGFQWIAKKIEDTNVYASRQTRRIYLSNLPHHLGLTEDSFSKQLYDSMKERGLCNDANVNPVLHVWFARDKGANYGFAEIATAEETERALRLDGMQVLGVPVSLKRPADGGGSNQGVLGTTTASQQPLPAGQGMATSTVIHIEELLKVDAKTSKEDYLDVVEDMNEGCGAHGKLISAFIVQPQHVQRDATLRAGDVYLKTASVEDASKIMRAMGHRKYDGRQIQMKSVDEDLYNRQVRPLI